MNLGCKSFRQFARRDFLRIGGASLCGVSLLDVLRARSQAAGGSAPKAKQMIVCWMAGGPPHTDMFDMKPDSPSDYKGEFKPIKSNLSGLDVCELMPKLATMADKYTIIRSITTMNKPGDHARAPMYWLTGNPRLPSGTDQYPMIGSVISKLQPGPAELPSFAVLGKIDHHINNSISSSFLGPAFSPFIFDPLESKDDIAKMLSPQMELPAFAKQADLLKAVDQRLRRQDRVDPLIEGLDKFQQTAFDMLRSPKLREALDLTKESEETIRKYKEGHLEKYRYPSGNPLHFLMARRLIEAGVPIVHFSLGYWDWHGENFIAGRQQIPMFDNALSLLLSELDERGLLDSTIVLALGEMGRKPKCGTDAKAGRDHWDYAQFVLAAGGGFKRGCIVGATDKLGEQVTDNFYKVESFGRTLYHLLGIDSDTIVHTPANRPVKLIVEEAPIVKEAII
jgi:hypothetical protein